MTFLSPWFFDFCRPCIDRFQVLTNKLKTLGVDFFPLQLGPFRHIHVPGPRPKRPRAGEKILLAHYDRFPGSPGANDNGASIFHLVEYLAEKKSAPLRIVFTDGEELQENKKIHQGSYWLGKLWLGVSPLFPMVFDMTGIGDTFVLSHLKQDWMQKLNSQSLLHDLKQQRILARRLLATCCAGDFVEIDTPFSDNLGFLLAGVGAVQISLLPRKQALSCCKQRVMNSHELPDAWKTMHTKNDVPQTLEKKTQFLMKELFEKLERIPFI